MHTQTKWNIVETKAKLSEIIQHAQKEHQLIESRGEKLAALISMKEYNYFLILRAQEDQKNRVQNFLQTSANLRKSGGVDLIIPKRKPRKSPFAKETR